MCDYYRGEKEEFIEEVSNLIVVLNQNGIRTLDGRRLRALAEAERPVPYWDDAYGEEVCDEPSELFWTLSRILDLKTRFAIPKNWWAAVRRAS